VFSPPRHQGHQAHPPALSNAKAQRRKDAKPTHPPIWPTDHTDPPTRPKKNAEAQRRRGAEGVSRNSSVRRGARSSKDVRAPLGRKPAPKTSFRTGFPTQRLALQKRKPRHISSLFNRWERHAPSLINKGEERQNRRALGTSAGEKTGDDGCLYPESSGFSPAAGDSIACRSAAKKRDRVSCSATAPLRLCVFAGWRGGWALRSLRFLGGWVALRLCGSAPLRSFWCSPLVSWCLGGPKTTRHP
jgi:hypothetical protein